jgi:hypothetical protein
MLKPKPEVFNGFDDLSLKTLDKLKGRSTVSKVYIRDLANQGDLKQPERDAIHNALEGEGDTVDVKAFANKVKAELLPLKRKTNKTPGYEGVTLSTDERGSIEKYSEHVYESPVANSAGDVHTRLGKSKGYFAHSRVEDVDPYDTSERVRRIVEIQSDLFQKGRLESEFENVGTGANRAAAEKMALEDPESRVAGVLAREKEIAKLEPYRNTWHERIIREEVKQAAKDGKTKLQFPTGETAMKIEGLGTPNNWYEPRIGRDLITVSPDTLKVGKTIENGNNDQWVITDVLGDGKFKAVPKGQYERLQKSSVDNGYGELPQNEITRIPETFDISGKIDTNNPIFKFYEKEIGRYLKNKYGATRVTDVQGVSWWEMPIKKDYAKAPIEAFGAGAGVQTDENGKVKFDPTAAALGVMGLGAAKHFHGKLPKTSKEIAKRYYDDVIAKLKASGTTIEISGDEMKKYFGNDYDPTRSDMYAAASFELHKKLLADPDIKTFTWVVGGPGSGKTEFFGKEIKAQNATQVLYETSFSNKKGVLELLDLAEEHGKTVTIRGALSDLDTARIHTILRGDETGRYVTDEVFANRHAQFPKVLREVLEEGRLRPDQLQLFDFRNMSDPELIRAKIAKGEFETDPLATLSDIRYNEEQLKKDYAAELFTRDAKGTQRQGERGIADAASRGLGDGPAGGQRTSPDAGMGRDVADAEAGMGDARVSIGEGSGGYPASGKRYTRAGSRPIRYNLPPIRTAEELASLDAAGRNAQLPTESLPDLPKLKLSQKAREALDAGGLKKMAAQIAEDRTARDVTREALSDSRERNLAKFQSRATGELPEVTGKKHMRSISGSGKKVKTSRFGQHGDDIVTELGYENLQEAHEAFDKYKKTKTQLAATEEHVRSRVKLYRDRKAVFDEVIRYVKEEGRARREQVKSVQDFFKFDNADMKSLLRNERDVRLMSDGEFDDFMKRLEGKATEQYLKLQDLADLRATIFEKEFVKLDNLRKALALPKIENMTPKQMREFNQLLQTFNQGDEFLGVRQIETVKNTDLKGIYTMREARERLLVDINKERAAAGKEPIAIDDLNSIKVEELDRYRYDAALARQDPFKAMMVQAKNEALLNADMGVFEVKDKVNDLLSAARASRSRGILDRLIPTDRRIFQWLEAPDADKVKLADDMTHEELEAAMYIREWYAEARDYLLAHNVLRKYRSDYITHIRRGFLEAWRDEGGKVAGVVSNERPGVITRTGTGLLAALKEVFDKYKQEAAYFNILDQKTDEVLPLEKFFQFSMKRSDQLTPTQNVGKAFLSYVGAFEKKKALDSLVPKLDIYAHSLTPKKMTPRGLEFDDSLKRFVKEWINTKKGRVTDRALFKPGGSMDWGLRTGVALTRIIDLGLSVPVGIASNLGAQTVVYRSLGEKAYATGAARLLTKQGRAITSKYKNFVGESVYEKIRSADSSLGDNLMTGIFGLFAIADRKAREVFLLGAITPDEFKAGAIATDRLARLQTQLGRSLPIENFESVMGKTAVGQVGKQYKTWAIPLISSTLDDLQKFQKAVRTGDRAYLKTPEAAELLRTIILGTAVGAGAYGILSDTTPMKDRTFVEKLAVKGAQDALSVVGALDPTLWTATPRLMQFVYDLSTALKQIVLAQKNKTGELTGVKKLETTVTPGAVKQFIPAASGSSKKPSALPSLPKLPKLPKLPSI